MLSDKPNAKIWRQEVAVTKAGGSSRSKKTPAHVYRAKAHFDDEIDLVFDASKYKSVGPTASTE